MFTEKIIELYLSEIDYLNNSFQEVCAYSEDLNWINTEILKAENSKVIESDYVQSLFKYKKQLEDRVKRNTAYRIDRDKGHLMGCISELANKQITVGAEETESAY